MLLTLIVSAAVIGPCAWLAWSTIRIIQVFRRRKVAFSCLGLWTAIAIGCALNLAGLSYHWSPELRVVGFPVPWAAEHLEGGEWVCFVMPAPRLNAILDIVMMTLLLLIPANPIVRIIRRRWGRQNPANQALDRTANNGPIGESTDQGTAVGHRQR